jgi:uncharacterized RDD family membrane protein YckC
VSEILLIIGLFRYKKISYDNNTVFIKTYFTGEVLQVPHSNIISIEKTGQYKSYGTMRSGRLLFSDGVQIQKIRFYLAYNLYSVGNLNSFMGVGAEPSPAFRAEQFIVTEKAEIDRGKRLGSALTDHFIMTMVAMLFAAPEIIYQFTHLQPTAETNLYSFATNNWYAYFLNIGFALYFCKDCIRGQSPAKFIFKFQVVNNETGEIAGPFRCLIRDVFILLWPIEAVILLINPSRRLGDRVAGTKVIIAGAESKPSKINFARLAVVFILAYPIMPLVAYLSDKLLVR